MPNRTNRDLEIIDRKGYYTGMPSKEYWEQRSKERLAETMKTSKEVEKYLTNVYKKGLEDTLDNYYSLMKPFVKDGEIDLAKLNNARFYDQSFIGKLRRLEKEIELFSNNVTIKEQKLILKTLMKEYKYVLTDTLADFNKSTGIELLNKNAIEQIVKTPFTSDGREFSQRIWNNLDTMHKNLKETLSYSIANGESVQKTAKKFQSIMGGARSNSDRIIRTETIACYNKASKTAYEKAGVEEVEILVEPNSCEECEKHKGIVKLFGAKVGVELPVYHPYCRCCIAPYFKREKG